MDTNVVLKRVIDSDIKRIRGNIRLINVFLVMDGKKSIQTIADEYKYDIDDLVAMVDQIEKLGLLVPVDGAQIEFSRTPSQALVVNLPAEFRTGIDTVDKQHERLVEMVSQLDKVRKTNYEKIDQRRAAIGNILSEMIDYTISHFAFEEALMEDANYEFFSAHKRIHKLLVMRAGEYKKRFDADEDIVDELHDVLKRWLFNHIRNDDKAFAPIVIKKLKLNKSRQSWLSGLLKRFFRSQ